MVNHMVNFTIFAACHSKTIYYEGL